MIVLIKADRLTDTFVAEVLGETVVLTPVKAGKVSAADRSVGIAVSRGLRIVIDARSSLVELQVVSLSGAREVFSQDVDPVVNYPAINFKPDPLTPDVSDMMFWEP